MVFGDVLSYGFQHELYGIHCVLSLFEQESGQDRFENVPGMYCWSLLRIVSGEVAPREISTFSFNDVAANSII